MRLLRNLVILTCWYSSAQAISLGVPLHVRTTQAELDKNSFLKTPPDVTKNRLYTIPPNPADRQSLFTRIEGVLSPQPDIKAPIKNNLAIVEYNIERGDHVAQQVEKLSKGLGIIPDIILLTESDRGCSRTENKNITYEYAKKFNMYYVYGTEFYEEALNCEHGNAILSKYPLENIKMVPFASDGDYEITTAQRMGKRMYLRADVVIGTKKLRVYVTHLAARFMEERTVRAQQAAQLAQDAATSPYPVVVGGDFNAFDYMANLRGIPSIDYVAGEFLKRDFKDAHMQLPVNQRITCYQDISETIKYPLVIDMFFVKNLTVKRSGVGPESVFKGLSDHFPIWAEIVLP